MSYHLTLREDGGPGADVELCMGQAGWKTVGWTREHNREIFEALHVAECLLRCPESLALFLQAARYESLEPAGGLTARRMERGAES